MLDNEVNVSKIEIRDKDDKNLPPRTCTLADIGIRVRNEVGNTVEDDCSCDSTYMLAAMDCVGRGIRKAYHWVPTDQLCYLVMDNAGGHGTKEAIEQYSKDYLKSIASKSFSKFPVLLIQTFSILSFGWHYKHESKDNIF